MSRYWDKSKPPTGAFTLNEDSQQAQSLVAWWPIGGASSNSFFTNYGNSSSSSGLLSNGSTPVILGTNGEPLAKLNGTSSYLETPNNALLTANSFTICLNLNLHSLANAYSGIANKIEAATVAYHQFYVKSNGKLAAYVRPNNAVTATTYDGTGQFILSTGVTYNLACYYNNATLKAGVFVNGTLDGEGPAASNGGLSLNTGKFAIGSDYVNANRTLAAYVGDIRYYNSVLSKDVLKHITSPEYKYELWYPLRSTKWISISSSTHDSTGVLVGQGSTIAGVSVYNVTHTSSGALSGQGSTLSGSANRFHAFSATGALVGQGSVITGAATHNIPHSSSGTLVGQGASISGSADRQPPGSVTHATTGALTGQGSLIAGTSARLRAFSSSGVLVGTGAVIAGDAAHNIPHATAGVLVGQGAIISGSATHQTSHAVTGALVGQNSVITGSAVHITHHTTTGVLVGSGAIMAGTGFVGTPPSDFIDWILYARPGNQVIINQKTR